MKSVSYARDYAEVKQDGQNTAHPATDPDITAKAWFWSVNFIAQFNETARQLTALHVTNIGLNGGGTDLQQLRPFLVGPPRSLS